MTNDKAQRSEMVANLREPRAGVHENGEEELKSWEQLYEQCTQAADYIAALSRHEAAPLAYIATYPDKTICLCWEYNELDPDLEEIRGTVELTPLYAAPQEPQAGRVDANQGTAGSPTANPVGAAPAQAAGEVERDIERERVAWDALRGCALCYSAGPFSSCGHFSNFVKACGGPPAEDGAVPMVAAKKCEWCGLCLVNRCGTKDFAMGCELMSPARRAAITPETQS